MRRLSVWAETVDYGSHDTHALKKPVDAAVEDPVTTTVNEI